MNVIHHEDIQGFLLALLRFFAGMEGRALVRGSRYPMRLDPRWSPEPDVLAVRSDRRHLMTKQRLEGPADLVIEVVSEADSHMLCREKLPRYREAAIPEIWIVDPIRCEVLVDLAGSGGRESLTIAQGRLESSAVPGFRIDVEWLWREELPPPHACLRERTGA